MTKRKLEKVFHPSDFSEGNLGAFAHALKLALEADAELSILHVRANSHDINWMDYPRVRDTLRKWSVAAGLEEHALEHDSHLHVRKLKASGEHPVEPIIEHVKKSEPDIVVLATHQRQGFDRWIHKSIAEPIARNASVMTLFVPRHKRGFVDPQTGRAALQNVLVPVDYSPSPARALSAVKRLGQVLNEDSLRVTALHVASGKDMPSLHTEMPPPWKLEKCCVDGEVEETILAKAEEIKADLIVMGTYGHDGFLDGLRGNTTERVLRLAPCPVLAVPAGKRG